jgi:hypothetical protein
VKEWCPNQLDDDFIIARVGFEPTVLGTLVFKTNTISLSVTWFFCGLHGSRTRNSRMQNEHFTGIKLGALFPGGGIEPPYTRIMSPLG